MTQKFSAYIQAAAYLHASGYLDNSYEVGELSEFIKRAMYDKTAFVFWVDEVRSVISFDEGGDLRIKTTPEVLKVLSALT
jgi:hypothetical protein